MNGQPPRGPKGRQKGQQNDPANDIICLCNEVRRGTIEGAIRGGCDTLNKIYDATTAGVGPCGGSCRRKIAPMLEEYQKTGQFPAPQPQQKPRRS